MVELIILIVCIAVTVFAFKKIKVKQMAAFINNGYSNQKAKWVSRITASSMSFLIFTIILVISINLKNSLGTEQQVPEVVEKQEPVVKVIEKRTTPKPKQNLTPTTQGRYVTCTTAEQLDLFYKAVSQNNKNIPRNLMMDGACGKLPVGLPVVVIDKTVGGVATIVLEGENGEPVTGYTVFKEITNLWAHLDN